MAQEWNIKARGDTCAICNETFSDGQGCVSALRQNEAEYERVDACHGCWQKTERTWEPFSLWEWQYEKPVAVVKEEPLKKETAEALLRRLVDIDDPAMQNVIYVLAVMLERSKQLIERDTRPDEGGVILRFYEHKATGDLFMVRDPRLQLAQIGDVQRQVVELLSGTNHLATDKSEPPPPGAGE